MFFLQRVAVQALQTFSKFSSKQSFPEQLASLKKLLSEISSNDLSLDPDLFIDSGPYKLIQTNNGPPPAPVTYVHLWEDTVFTMGVFILKHGVTLPLHDHPQMHGLIKVLHGKAHINAYTEVTGHTVPEEVLNELRPWQRQGLKTVNKVMQKEVTPESDTCELSPVEGNLHEIRAVDGPAAFLDILAPPYDHQTGERECHYFREVTGIGSEKDFPKYFYQISQPREFWCSQSEYLGPDIDPYADLL